MKTEIKDKDLEDILKQKLKKDPVYYLSFLRKIVDGIHIHISDEALFRRLKPRMVYRDEEAILRAKDEWEQKHKAIEDEMNKVLEENQGISREKIIEDFDRRHNAIDEAPLEYEDIYDPLPSGEGIDFFCNPGVRQKLKTWQREYFDIRLQDFERDKARDNIERVFRCLLYKGSSGTVKLTSAIQDQITARYPRIQRKVKQIFQSTRQDNEREQLIKGSFGGIGKKIVEDEDGVYAYETERDTVNSYFAVKYNVTPKTIDEYLRETQKPFKYMKDPSVTGVIIDGPGVIIDGHEKKDESVILEYENGSEKIVK